MNDISQKPLQNITESSQKQWVSPIVEIIGTDNIQTGTHTGVSEAGLINYGAPGTVIKHYAS